MAAICAGDQKAAFAERLNRINSGKQYEHADVIGHHTQKAWKHRQERQSKRSRRGPGDVLMVVIAFLAGASAVLLGKLGYFYMSKITGLPPAFYDLGGRGMALFVLVLTLILVMLLQLSTRGRLQALALGCTLMHFGESAVASTAPELYSELFAPDYVATVAEMASTSVD